MPNNDIGPSVITDLSSGCPTFLSLVDEKISTLNYPINTGSRLVLLSGNRVLIINSKSVFILDLQTMKKSPCPDLKTYRENFSAVLFDNIVLVTGGESVNELEICEAFDGNEWFTLTKMNISRSWHSSIVWNEIVYVFGGLRTSSIERLKGKWEVLQTKLPWNINRIGLSCFNDRLLVVGGEVLGTGYSTAGWEFDKESLKLLATKPCPAQGLFYSQGAFYKDSCYFLTGGLVILYNTLYRSWAISQKLTN
ncbi:hypothetical protein SteCoe_6712 [Stentor coeruleus]|uniref:Uncharacterized protein n=1 Tax=Stentor coeruleus TaxID=5963 RepID=A0A1R2CPB6_9CILI|nr:hypothetical protein SteCoe_6712 [Stentor coeruleus]